MLLEPVAAVGLAVFPLSFYGVSLGLLHIVVDGEKGRDKWYRRIGAKKCLEVSPMDFWRSKGPAITQEDSNNLCVLCLIGVFLKEK